MVGDLGRRRGFATMFGKACLGVGVFQFRRGLWVGRFAAWGEGRSWREGRGQGGRVGREDGGGVASDNVVGVGVWTIEWDARFDLRKTVIR
jgi:hypothetical protein